METKTITNVPIVIAQDNEGNMFNPFGIEVVREAIAGDTLRDYKNVYVDGTLEREIGFDMCSYNDAFIAQAKACINTDKVFNAYIFLPDETLKKCIFFHDKKQDAIFVQDVK